MRMCSRHWLSHPSDKSGSLRLYCVNVDIFLCLASVLVIFQCEQVVVLLPEDSQTALYAARYAADKINRDASILRFHHLHLVNIDSGGCGEQLLTFLYFYSRKEPEIKATSLYLSIIAFAGIYLVLTGIEVLAFEMEEKSMLLPPSADLQYGFSVMVRPSSWLEWYEYIDYLPTLVSQVVCGGLMWCCQW